MQIRSWSVPCFAAVLIGACAPKEQQSDVAAVRAQIDKGNATFTTALAKHDTAGIMSVYDPDAVVLLANAPALSDVASRRASMAAMMNANAAIKLATSDVHVSGDLAVETGHYVLTLQPDLKTGPVTDSGKYVVVWKKQADGSWKIFRDAPSTDLPPMPVAQAGAPRKK